ncbi:S24 family peptidase [Photobacterium damselae]|uniref:S24 family peptidase n=1 Tax=Photobacterium damselae TaxID=38293 RepID=UPI001F2EE3F5|nr:S24 family peptidase [Photobacterium damselae]UKA11741.1 helix-turn-helix domain-containing protein [Photobacterium damselae subsp. damselae]
MPLLVIKIAQKMGMTLGDRIKERRQTLELTQEELAQKVAKVVTDMKFSRVSLSNIELGVQNSVKDKVLLALSDFLKCTPEWLVYGTSPINNDQKNDSIANVDIESTLTQQCPLISWVQAGVFTEIGEYPESDYQYYPSPVKCGSRTFILRVHGDSMMDRFHEGDLIYVDPDQIEPIHGKFVIAQLEDSAEATFKQLQIVDGQKLLKALNPNYPADMKYIKINSDCRLIGTVIAHVKPI